MPIDFFARRSHYVDHMLPVWNALDENDRGLFHTPGDQRVPRGSNPMLVAGVADLQVVQPVSSKRKFIFMEHGVGITYGAHQSYAGGGGLRRKVDLFLAPNEIVREKTERAIPGVKQVVIGTPKLDRFAVPGWREGRRQKAEGGKPVVAISFHWDGHRVQPEAGNALKHFQKILPALARCDEFQLIGHGHPRLIEQLIPIYNSMGIMAVRDFDEVMERADLYVCDNSSTIYEFCVTGKPVVIMNAPQYRRNVHWGIRFWDYTDIGPMVDEPEELVSAIRCQVSGEGGRQYAEAQARAVRDLYPFLGESANRAAAVLREFIHVS